jgi:tetratricopeptide (TPR) repeat protein
MEQFIEVFGYLPTFKTGDRIFDGSANRNEAVSYAKNDWIFNPDCDEIVSWELPAIKKLLPTCDIVDCKLTCVNDGDKYDTRKLFDRRKAKFVGRIHELPVGDEARVVKTDKMTIKHYQKDKAHRNTYLPVVEYAALKDGDIRLKFYLGKEYGRMGMYGQAVKAYQIYLSSGSWLPEVMEAYTFMSKCLWLSGKKEEALYACMQAIVINPDYRESLLQMAMMLPEHAEVWKRYAKHAKNSDALIVRY